MPRSSSSITVSLLTARSQSLQWYKINFRWIIFLFIPFCKYNQQEYFLAIARKIYKTAPCVQSAPTRKLESKLVFFFFFFLLYTLLASI